MPEISDQLLLQVNGQLRVISEEAVLAARRRQIESIAAGGRRRTLFDILRAEGLIDPDSEARILSHPSVSGAVPIAKTTTIQLFGPPPGERKGGEENPPPLLIDAPELGLSPPTPLITFTPPARSGGENLLLKPASRPRPPEVEEAEKLPENKLGTFILVKEVGRGGTGKVYRAWDTQINRFVALKVISSNDPEIRQRCVREAQIAGRLNHSAIATVYQAGEDQGRCYIAMQFIDGSQIGAAKMPFEKNVALIRDAARALSYAHEQGIVHRDVKPGNLMLDRQGRVFLTDFGLAKEVMGGFGTHVSISGTVLGTPSYMAPEQAAGRVKEIDYRSDIYSLGATLYALLAGRPPFVGEGVSAILMAVVHRRPPPLSKFNSEVSPELEMTIGRAMAKDPARRFPSMGAFADELDRLLHEKRFAGRYGWAKMVARRWIPVAAAVMVAGLGARFGLDAWSKRATASASIFAGEPTDEVSKLRDSARLALEEVESQYAELKPEVRGERLRQVIERLDKALKQEPADLGSLVLRARAHYVGGMSKAAAEQLQRLARRSSEDYRIPFLRALLATEHVLDAVVPLPALEAPRPEWESEPPAWPEAAARELQAVRIPEASADNERDRAALRGLQRLAEGRWGDAADALAEARRVAPLPVIVRAWSRAAYLSKRFREVRALAGADALRERVGAGLALAFESANPAEPLGSLLKEADGDPWAAAMLRVALARCDSGVDPAPHASSALEALKGAAGPGEEFRAAVESARLRWRSLSGSDAEADYRKAIEALGNRPSTWAGKLAAVELRLGLGARLLRRRGEGRPWLEEAVRRVDELAPGAGEWAAPRILRASARIHLDHLEDASAELDELSRKPECGVRAFLVAASARMRIAERKRRSGISADDDVQRARELAAKALASVPGHPEGRVLSGAALLAARGPEDAEALKEVVEEATRALERAPGFVEASFLRGGALFYSGVAAARAGRDGRSSHEGAASDFDAVLQAEPEFAAALRSRGVVRFKLDRYDEALADWRKAVQLDPSLDTEDLRAHVQQAEDRRKRP